MERTSINPWEWGLAFSMDQAELVEGVDRLLHCSGQVSVRPAAGTELGFEVFHPNDIRGQMQAALANVDSVLREAGMDRGTSCRPASSRRRSTASSRTATSTHRGSSGRASGRRSR